MLNTKKLAQLTVNDPPPEAEVMVKTFCKASKIPVVGTLFTPESTPMLPTPVKLNADEISGTHEPFTRPIKTAVPTTLAVALNCGNSKGVGSNVYWLRFIGAANGITALDCTPADVPVNELLVLIFSVSYFIADLM